MKESLNYFPDAYTLEFLAYTKSWQIVANVKGRSMKTVF